APPRRRVASGARTNAASALAHRPLARLSTSTVEPLPTVAAARSSAGYAHRRTPVGAPAPRIAAGAGPKPATQLEPSAERLLTAVEASTPVKTARTTRRAWPTSVSWVPDFFWRARSWTISKLRRHTAEAKRTNDRPTARRTRRSTCLRSFDWG